MRKIILPVILIIPFLFFGWQLNGKEKLNLIINSKPAYLFSILPRERLYLVEIPEKTLIEVAHGYGKYRLESIYGLGLIENRGGELLVDSVQESFGIPIDGYILTEKDPKFSITKIITESIQKKTSTNLGRLTLLRLWWQIRKLRADQIKEFSLTSENELKKVEQADGLTAFEFDPDKTDQFLGGYFKEPNIRQEDLAIAILNATDHPGLAQRAARLVNNIGGRVVKVSDFEQRIADCQIWVSAGVNKSQTYSRLSKIYHCQLKPGPVSEMRADLVIILGEKYWQKLTEK